MDRRPPMSPAPPGPPPAPVPALALSPLITPGVPCGAICLSGGVGEWGEEAAAAHAPCPPPEPEPGAWPWPWPWEAAVAEVVELLSEEGSFFGPGDRGRDSDDDGEDDDDVQDSARALSLAIVVVVVLAVWFLVTEEPVDDRPRLSQHSLEYDKTRRADRAKGAMKPSKRGYFINRRPLNNRIGMYVGQGNLRLEVSVLLLKEGLL